MENKPSTPLAQPKILLSKEEAQARATQIHAEMQIKYEALKYAAAMLVSSVQGKGVEEATKALDTLPTLRTRFETEIRTLLENGK